MSPTLLLPGPHGEESRTEIDIHVGTGATLTWLPQLVIAAHGCRHRTDTRITLDAGARLLLREEVLFGRHDEPAGSLRQRLQVEVGGHPVYDQELAAGPDAPGGQGPAVTAGNRSVGSVLVVDPGHPRPDHHTADGTAASMALPGDAVVVSALADDTTTLRRRLDAGLAPPPRAPRRAGSFAPLPPRLTDDATAAACSRTDAGTDT